MLKLPIKKWDILIHAIRKEDLWQEKPGFGRELDPHITILYGFHDNVDPSWIKECVYTIKNPIELQLDSITHFNNKVYDVLHFSVSSPRLHKLNEIFSKFPHSTFHKNYQPHACIAYLKQGTGEKYHRELKNPIKLLTNTYIYSEAMGRKWEWDNDKKIERYNKDFIETRKYAI